MKQGSIYERTPRRDFIGKVAAGAAAFSMASIAPLALHAAPLTEMANNTSPSETPDEWFDKIKGKHRIVFDSTHPAGIFAFAWPRVFLLTNEKTGTPASDCGVVVVLRHSAIPFAMQHSLWEKYKFGEMFKIDDAVSKQPSVRNPFWQPKKGDFKLPGFGEVMIGINELQADGVMFCVCDAALTVFSAAAAGKMNMDAAAVKTEWLAGLLPGIMPVPSGVWAVGRAQEHKCSYCFVAD
jgi:hypothetical protein